MGKRLLIHYPVLNVGGAEMSTLRLTRALADRGWQIDLVVTTGGGAMESQLDSRVRLFTLRSRQAGGRFAQTKDLTGIFRALPDLFAYGIERAREATIAWTFLFRRYDAAVVGLQGLSAAFCCRYVVARRRLLWIRIDVGADVGGEKFARNVQLFDGCIDTYVCVSKYARDALVACYPATGNRAVTVYNILDSAEMRRQSEETSDPFAAYGRSLKVLTVCRLQEKQKGLDRMARVHRRLLDEGLDFHWFVVGDGPDKASLEATIEALKLGDRFTLLGRQPNPFPYYAHADVVAVLSNYEGLCGAVNEAKVMGKPVVATTFSGVFEQLEDGVSGLIVENNEDAIVEGMRRVLTGAALRAKLAAGPLNPTILDDEAKLDTLEALMLGGPA